MRSSSTSRRPSGAASELVGVLETHTHADHVSGHGRLALERGLPVRVHEAAGAAFAHEPLADGTEIHVGDLVVRTVHTPGHRPEHCAFAIVDTTRGGEPWLVLTGDSLFVGDAARPDLAVESREGAEGLFTSLRRLVALGDGVEVYPGHVAGSLCGAAMSSKASTTIGYERQLNHALLESQDDFLAAALGPQPPRPPNMERIVESTAARSSARSRGSSTVTTAATRSCSTCGRRARSPPDTTQAPSTSRCPGRASGRSPRSSFPSDRC